ncbi:hypothetical protein BX666DRAFT_1963551 [Dichotomocladium elegans]|nr:hypothetical protein BX666DRAFT_1963551 [Dichotomocladium elegans]
MSHMLDKPRLPGIQFLLNSPEDREKKAIVTEPPTTSSPRPVMGHRSTRSVSSLPSDLQKLSLYPSSKDDSEVHQGTAGQLPPQLQSLPFTHSVKPPFTSNATASWNTPPSTTTSTTPTSNMHRRHLHAVPTVLLPPLPTTDNHHQLRHQPQHQHEHQRHHTLQPPPLHSRRSGHGRSMSEYTLPPHPLAPRPVLPFDTNSILATPTPISTVAGGGGGGVVRTHRRAVSANTVDFMLRSPAPTPTTPSSSTSTSSSSNDVLRAQSDSPPERRLRSPPSLSVLQDAVAVDDQTQQQLQRDATSGRYLCQFCNKGFSRPSSLRIHTYSHTGEKPYVCTEDGCGRRFSVQSNMRRHLRVHRLGRQAMKSSPLRKP